MFRAPRKASKRDNYVTIPKAYNNTVVKTTLTAPRFYQYTTKYYFSSNLGAQFASAMETQATTVILALLAGFTPKIGPAITIAFTFAELYKSGIRQSIRDRTDHGKKVFIQQMVTPYGTFYGVFDWNSRRILTHTTYNDGMTNEVLNNLQYK